MIMTFVDKLEWFKVIRIRPWAMTIYHDTIFTIIKYRQSSMSVAIGSSQIWAYIKLTKNEEKQKVEKL